MNFNGNIFLIRILLKFILNIIQKEFFIPDALCLLKQFLGCYIFLITILETYFELLILQILGSFLQFHFDNHQIQINLAHLLWIKCLAHFSTGWSSF